MASQALTGINLRVTPQTESATPEQVKNSAGGFVFAVTAETRLRRFLTLGTDGGTYYVGQKELTKDTAAIVLDFARNRTTDLVAEIVSISEAGRAPKQDPAVFALAAASALGDPDGRRAALAALPRVCRTGTHLFLFATYVQQFRGWGRGLRRAIADWYTSKDADRLAYQVVKYRQREGWTHRDLLRLSHPQATGDVNALLKWVTHPDLDVPDGTPVLVSTFLAVQAATTVPQWVDLINVGHGLSWEMLPDAALNERAVWEALLDQGVPQTALIRQLPRLTRLGLFNPGSTYLGLVAGQLADPERLAKGRVHPVNVLIAARTYASGVSARGAGTWSSNGKIVDALDAAFYAAFGAVRKTGKRHLLALDVSGSMGTQISGLPITCREASVAIALVTAAVEPDTTIVGFTGGHGQWSGYSFPHGTTSDPLTVLSVSPRQRLDDAIRYVDGLPFGGTDCALPSVWARENGHDFDAISVYTDNETWAGAVHPFQALTQYRQAIGHDVKQIVVGMTATNFSIADPRDASSLDVSGFDSAVPGLIADFAAGDL